MPALASSWSVVVPVKALPLAKSRLRGAAPGDRHDDLVLAMATDTILAALAATTVSAVLVVTDDPRAAGELNTRGVVVVPDRPGAGLNAALVHGAEEAARRAPHHGVATLSADLPALRPVELDAALTAAARHRRAFVADAAGEGTTLLTAAPGIALAPAFGPGSRRRHRSAGAVDLDLPGLPGLRRDVDTHADLAAARRLGLGPNTARLLRRGPA